MDGKDSNGCFIELDNKEFSKAVFVQNDTEQGEVKKKTEPSDDYNLYRMVYINKDGEIKNEKNPNLSKQVINYYNLLKKIGERIKFISLRSSKSE